MFLFGLVLGWSLGMITFMAIATFLTGDTTGKHL